MEPASRLARMEYEAPPLPIEVLRIIFSFCDAATVLASARGVCRTWRAFVNDPSYLPWAKLALGASLRCGMQRCGVLRRVGLFPRVCCPHGTLVDAACQRADGGLGAGRLHAAAPRGRRNQPRRVRLFSAQPP